MFRMLLLSCALLLMPCALNSCGYRLGGAKPTYMEKMETFSVEMFRNYTTQPQVSMQLTTALTDAIQRDGTYRLSSARKSDFRIVGEIVSITPHSLTTDWRDTYLSSEIGLQVSVNYRLIDNATGKQIGGGSVSSMASYFNEDSINVQSARDNALSYACRKAADDIVSRLTTP